MSDVLFQTSDTFCLISDKFSNKHEHKWKRARACYDPAPKYDGKNCHKHDLNLNKFCENDSLTAPSRI